MNTLPEHSTCSAVRHTNTDKGECQSAQEFCKNTVCLTQKQAGGPKLGNMQFCSVSPPSEHKSLSILGLGIGFCYVIYSLEEGTEGPSWHMRNSQMLGEKWRSTETQ